MEEKEKRWQKGGPLRLTIAGGGTGGHIFPGIAILAALREITPVEVLWIGTGRAVEREILAGMDIDYKQLDARPVYGVGIGKALSALFGLPSSILVAKRALKGFSPHIVLGIGGYVAGPVLAASRMLRIPLVIHEQNLIPGLTNRWGGRLAERIFVSFSGSRSWFPKGKTLLTGNPVRSEFLRGGEVGEPSQRYSDIDQRPKRILVIGGSQGARAINRLVTSALTILSESGVDFQVVHQTGRDDLAYTERVYREAGIRAEVHPFIRDMATRYQWADLVVSRSGAGTCAELAVTGTPSILIPYPHAASSHQEANAKELESVGASITLRESEVGPERLAATIEGLLRDGQRLSRMSRGALSIARPEAARIIAEEMVKIAREGSC